MQSAQKRQQWWNIAIKLRSPEKTYTLINEIHHGETAPISRSTLRRIKKPGKWIYNLLKCGRPKINDTTNYRLYENFTQQQGKLHIKKYLYQRVV